MFLFFPKEEMHPAGGAPSRKHTEPLKASEFKENTVHPAEKSGICFTKKRQKKFSSFSCCRDFVALETHYSEEIKTQYIKELFKIQENS